MSLGVKWLGPLEMPGETPEAVRVLSVSRPVSHPPPVFSTALKAPALGRWTWSRVLGEVGRISFYRFLLAFLDPKRGLVPKGSECLVAPSK